MDNTPNLQLPYLIAAQAQKHVTHNEALRTLDAVVQLLVLDKDLATPPGSPSEGSRYIVAASPTGAWAGHAADIAAYQDGAWMFYPPREGWLAWVADEDKPYVWGGSAWAEFANPGSGALLWGVNATADTTNRLALSSPASLFNHAGAGHQQKINKNAAGDTASVLFQTGFSGRAEFGTTGDDDWHVKVSADGSAWFEALVADRATGLLTLVGDPVDDLGAATKQYVDAAASAGLGDGDKGDITVASGGTAWTIDNDAVTYAKMQNVSATDRLLGRDTAGAGDPEELTVGGGVEFTGSGGIQRSALTGDVTASAGSNATTIANDAVTYAKLQNVSATDRLLGRDTAGAGDAEELTVGGGVEFTGSGGIQRSALTGDVTASAGSNATTVVAASDTVAGKVELATAAETTTGTDAARAVTPDGLAGSDYGKRVVGILVSEPGAGGAAITTGDGKAYFRVPAVMNGWNLVGVAASLSTVSSSGAVSVQVRNATQAADMLSTALSIDASETDSATAATPAAIDTGNDDVATGDQVNIDIDGAGTGAKGLYVELVFQLP